MPASVTDVFTLPGRTAVVTGASSGIGAATARVLAAAGAAVYCGDRDEVGLAATVQAIRAAGGTAEPVPTDVTDRASVDALVAAAVEGTGRLDACCNIAGVIGNVALLDVDDAEFDRIMSVNLRGVFYGCQAAGRAMAARGGGAIVNMASGAIDQPAAGIVCYAMSKAAVAQLTRTAAVELGPHGIRVNAVAPGFIITAMTGRHFTDAGGRVDEQRRQAVVEPMRQRSPIGLVGDPDDIAWAVLYLVSDAARFVTGQVVRPNGGVTMGL